MLNTFFMVHCVDHIYIVCYVTSGWSECVPPTSRRTPRWLQSSCSEGEL